MDMKESILQEFFEDRFYGDYENIEENNLEYQVRNVGKEFLSVVKNHKVLCVDIVLKDDFQSKSITLKIGYSDQQYLEVLNEMFHCWYGGGYEQKHLYGTIWCDNHTWFERAECDGMDIWVRRDIPEIPDYLIP